MDGARRDPIEMRHQLHIIAVIQAEMLEIVGEFLAASIVLLEVGEAAGERVPAGIDDLRLGKHQPDETNVQPIVRHLVDEEGPVRFALGARALEIGFAEAAEVAG